MKTLVIDAILGAGFAGSFTLATQAEKAGLALFTGNLHDEPWRWQRDKLEALELEELQGIYEGVRSEREIEAQRVAANAVAGTVPINLSVEVH